MKAKRDVDTDAVLSTLEQLSQTMEAMNQVIHRLKQRVEAVQSADTAQDSVDQLILGDNSTVH